MHAKYAGALVQPPATHGSKQSCQPPLDVAQKTGVDGSKGEIQAQLFNRG